jgi:hypothetical protein
MKQAAFLRTVGILMMMVAVTLPVWAADEKPDIVGEWRLSRVMPADAQNAPAQRGGMMSSILTLSRDKDGKLTGQIIGMMGITELNNLKFENGTLSFSQTMRMRQEETVSTFTGTVKEGKLIGKQTSPRGEVEMEGTKIPTPPAIVGNWEITTTRGDQQMVTILSVTTDKDGKIAAAWQPQRGQGQREQGQRQQGDRPQGQRQEGDRSAQADRPQGQRGFGELSDVQYKDGKLTFSRRMMMGRRTQQQDQQQDQQQERVSTYVLTAKGDVLTGTVTNQQGERPIEGKRAAVSPVVGTWLLTLTSERGDRTQRLVVYPDMTGLYGATPVEAVTVEDKAVGFKISMSFGDRNFETTFKGTLDGDKLTGQLSSTGFNDQVMTQDVVGKKK